mmetsp:Transcript_13331/g.40238  ORF Transcript_13331/g.40238 Transcript_13331/m.40238 type:complete len:194 (+) Transcript_13331:208-789(+)
MAACKDNTAHEPTLSSDAHEEALSAAGQCTQCTAPVQSAHDESGRSRSNALLSSEAFATGDDDDDQVVDTSHCAASQSCSDASATSASQTESSHCPSFIPSSPFRSRAHRKSDCLAVSRRSPPADLSSHRKSFSQLSSSSQSSIAETSLQPLTDVSLSSRSFSASPGTAAAAAAAEWDTANFCFFCFFYHRTY